MKWTDQRSVQVVIALPLGRKPDDRHHSVRPMWEIGTLSGPTTSPAAGGAQRPETSPAAGGAQRPETMRGRRPAARQAPRREAPSGPRQAPRREAPSGGTSKTAGHRPGTPPSLVARPLRGETPRQWLEVVVVDVLSGPDERWAKQDFAAVGDRKVTKSAGGHRGVAGANSPSTIARATYTAA